MKYDKMNTQNEIEEISEQNLLFEDLQEPIAQVEPEENNEGIEKPYDPQLIDIRPQTLALVNIIRRLREDAIDLYPDFQRSANLWNARQQSLLIESMLIRIPLPAFYFDGTNNNKWQVIDGLQRLCTIKNFVVLQTLKLTNLEYLNQFDGCSFAELPLHLQRQIEETNVTAYIMNMGAPDVKYNIFKRINTGGVTLNPQEIRNALNQGVPADFVAELASTDSFKQAAKLSDRRMQDKEFVTRFVTFYLNKPEEYKPDLDTFMSNAMSKLYSFSEEERCIVKQNFIASMSLANEIFGKWAFRKVYDKNKKRLYPINKALFEVWSILLAKLSDAERQIVREAKESIFNDYIKLMNEDSDFVGAITSQTDNKNKILYRFGKIEQLLKNRLS
ncbi:MAG: DUF262 domain-containing protein [Prevotellaceae bacterium]|jgi:hypothetical protein|nr:DUF262 domain-containing protein [Prevotellaceae bacterium]